jgi:hypothetical protein
MANRQETGDDGVLIVNGQRVPFTNVSYDLEYETDESNFNDGLHEDSAYVSRGSSGTIEADGSKSELKNLLLNDDGTPTDDIRIIMTGSEGGDRFTDVKITNFGREFPGGGKTSTQIDWRASGHRPING